MKLKPLGAALAIIFATGCTTVDTTVSKIEDPLEAKPDIKEQEVTFLQDHGMVTLEFDETGAEWIAIQSTGTSPITFNHANSREEAMTVATSRARANLVEFLSNNVKTEKFIEDVSKTILNDKLTNGTITSTEPVTETDIFGDQNTVNTAVDHVNNNEERTRATKVAQQVKRTLHESSNGIIKGALVTKRAVNPDVQMVAVTVRVSKKSINTAHKIRAQMDGQ